MRKKDKSVSIDTDKKKKHISTKEICYIAILVSLSVVANTFTVYTNYAGSNALAFTYTVDFVAGALFGPLGGFLTGILGDVLGYLANPSGGAYNPVLSLTSGLLGLIPGLVFFLYKKLFGTHKKYLSYYPLVCVLSYILVWIFCTNVNTLLMYVYYIGGKSKKYTSFLSYYTFRIPWQTLFWGINLILSASVIIPLKKLLKL